MGESRCCRAGELSESWVRGKASWGDGEFAEIEDIVQDTFLKAYSRLETFQQSSAFYTWLYRIAINTILDFMKRQGRSPVQAVEDPEDDQKRGNSRFGLVQRLGSLVERAQPHEVLEGLSLVAVLTLMREALLAALAAPYAAWLVFAMMLNFGEVAA